MNLQQRIEREGEREGDGERDEDRKRNEEREKGLFSALKFRKPDVN